MKKLLLKIIYHTLALFARFYIYRTKPVVIGVTGSVGKTSCRMIIYQVLQKYLKDKTIYTSPKNFNSELGIIFSIFRIEKYNPSIFSLIKIIFVVIKKTIFSHRYYDILVLEYGVDHPGDMDFLLSIIKPDISIFTKLDYIHAENFSSKEAIGQEKFKLIKATKKKTYLNNDDEFLSTNYNSIKIEKEFFNTKLLASKYEKHWASIFSKIIFDGKNIKTNILGKENHLYIELAYKILLDFGVDIVGEQFLELQNQPGRFSIFPGIKDSILIDSTYNAGPESMKVMIENTIELRDKLFPDYKLGFVIGDMRELGDVSENEHKKLYKLVEDKDLIVSIGKETKESFPEEIKNFTNSHDAGVYLKDFLLSKSDKYLILFKGSQNTIFIEETLKQVLKDKSFEKNLVRQDKIWIEKKKYLSNFG
ncbi:MAG: Mur ligase family protein [Candidatus Gracilibacteria bacterium]|nr:Mur ligase family protein [Candidatus Gracilibacteria bacterium]